MSEDTILFADSSSLQQTSQMIFQKSPFRIFPLYFKVTYEWFCVYRVAVVANMDVIVNFLCFSLEISQGNSTK